MAEELCNEYREVRLEINIDKTKIISRNERKKVKLKGKELEYINEYKYVGKTLEKGRGANLRIKYKNSQCLEILLST